MARSGNLSSLFGTISFNGKQINLPSRNEKKIELNQGDIKPKRIGIEPRITGVADKLGNRPYADIVDEKAKKYGVFPELVHAVIQAESSYNPRAVSPVGAVGLMQLMPGTAKRFGVRDSTNPRQNIDGGVRYLRFLLDYFENNLRLAVAGYNAGENAVIKHGRKIPPYKETRQYVTRVMKYLHRNLDKTQSQHLSSLI
ncbi:MAG: lytic transglycosylase domain-containing protein [Pseudomonadota bacterium]